MGRSEWEVCVLNVAFRASFQNLCRGHAGVKNNELMQNNVQDEAKRKSKMLSSLVHAPPLGKNR